MPYSSSDSCCSSSNSEITQHANIQSLSFSNKISNSSSAIENTSNASENPTTTTSKDINFNQENDYFISFEDEFEELESSMFSDSDSELNENEKYDILTLNTSKLLDKDKVDPTDFENEYNYTPINEQKVEDFKTDNEKISSVENYVNRDVWKNSQSNENSYFTIEPDKSTSNDQDGETMTTCKNCCDASSFLENKLNKSYVYETQNTNIYQELSKTVSSDSDNANKINDYEQSHIYESIPMNLDSINKDSNPIVDCIKLNEADELSADSVVTKEFENIIHEILFGIGMIFQ